MREQTGFESIVEALKQAIAYEKGDETMGKVRVVTLSEIIPKRNEETRIAFKESAI